MIATLATARLCLRPLQPEDEALYVGLYTDPDTLRHVLAPQTGDAARRGFAAALSGQGTAEGKFAAMEAAGVTTVKSPGDLGAAIAKRLAK